ncbi:Alstrom syndrome protein 1 like a [Pseudolycoriella hygida]|uniref:Alstrom syndrome protein 1 like a n=1 Tax=Pseudolycoriella hygida TaxID=35572 RepID=A0A9Q0MQ35_9DIPT|nr:Alstrom syndrome protein 1 like a [Pseudolycoriella hygida]
MASYNKATFANIDPKCSKRSAQIPSALSSTILDYYNKYGRNRDLEKYLRFRNRSSSGSSSIQLSPSDECRIGKSLENINLLESSLVPEEIQQKSKSSDSLNKSGHSNAEGTLENPDKQIKLTSKRSAKSKKKYNINMDTCIEITLPQQLTNEQKLLTHPTIQHDFSQQKIEFDCSETQTDRIEFPKTPNQSELEGIDVPARPSSVASSAASVSNKQRLEWDSMADVGYYKSNETNRLTNLTEFERQALQKFFASHGVSFGDEMVVFASKSKLSSSVPELTRQAEKARIREKWEDAFRKILEEKYAKRNGKGKDCKRVWQSALTKFREKYGTHFNPESDLCITEPAVHSTPIGSDALKGAIPKMRTQVSDATIQTEDVSERTEKVEKACQTSRITNSSKECQVNDTSSDAFSALDFQGISSENSKESEKSTDFKEGLTSAASFEFVPPKLLAGRDKENIPPSKKEMNLISQAMQIVSDEDKENVPPKVPDNNEIFENVVLTTPKNATTDSSGTDELFGVISSLENDIAKGVEVLCSLANSKKLSENKKKQIVRKIIKRITNVKYKDSTASSESVVSSSSSDSEKSKSVVRNSPAKSNISGISKLSGSSSSCSSSHNVMSSSSVKVKSPLKQSGPKENSIQDWLKPITNSEVEHERKKSKEIIEVNESKSEQPPTKGSIHTVGSLGSQSSECDSNILKFVEKQRQSQLEWIDKEICHLKNLKEYLKKKREADIMKDIIDLQTNRKDSHSADSAKESDVIYENVCTSETTEGKTHKKLDEREASLSNFQESKNGTSNASSSIEWDSHINMKQFVRNRKKLQTPNDDIVSYAHAKEQEFIGKYEGIRSRPIYTKPYSSEHSDHYSEPHDNVRKASSKKNTNHAYTSITGSDGFLSSNSVSIAVANSTSNTTTHQYDTRASVAIQTSGSLTRTAPIFKTKCHSCNCRTDCDCRTTNRQTIRVKCETNDKQLQVIPKPISFDINFDKNETKATNGDRMKSGMQHSESSSTSSKENKKTEKNVFGNFGGCTKLSLQDHLISARPEFVSQADERRKCLMELHRLRVRRNEQRNRLFLLSTNHSLRNHIQKLNPSPVAGKRIFTTKAFKQQTRNRYNKLPEIISKAENERKNRIKRSNRIVRDVFNKNLQSRVLKGQTDLSNSVFVAAI